MFWCPRDLPAELRKAYDEEIHILKLLLKKPKIPD
jgi:hypothetical protein